MTFAHQDWETVVFRGGKSSSNKVNSVGEPKETVHRVSGASREYSDLARKLEAETAVLPTLNSEMRKAMIQARVAKKMTQEQLAKMANTQVSTIKAMESGNVVTDRPALQNVNRILGTKLRLST